MEEILEGTLDGILDLLEKSQKNTPGQILGTVPGQIRDGTL